MNKKLLASLALVALASSTLAATNVWDGTAGDGMYTNGGNWGGTAPTDDLTTDIAQLTGGTVDLDTTRQVSGLDYSSGSTLSGVGSLEIGSGGINVGGNSVLNTAGLALNQPNTTITLDGGRLSLGSGLTASGTGQLTVTGNNTLFIDGGANTYSGGTVITGGASVRLKNGDNLGSGNITIDNGTLAGNGASIGLGETVTIGSGGATTFANGGYFSFQNTISGAGTLNVINGGGQTVFIDQDNSATFTGDVHINGATALASVKQDSIALDSGTANLILEDGGTLAANGANLSLTGRDIMLNGTGGTIKSAHNRSIFDIDGSISGTGGLTFAHAGSGGRVELGGSANTYSGGTRIEEGVSLWVSQGSTNSLGTGVITLAGGELKNNNSRPVHNNDIVIENTGGTVTAGWNNRNVTLNGDISGTGKLTIGDDSSTVVINGTGNTYSGGTDILGNVQVKGGGSLGTGDILIDNGGFLKNNNSTPVFANNVEIGSGGGVFQAGWGKDITFNGVASGSGTLTVKGDSGFLVLNNANNTFDGDIAFVTDYAAGNLSVASLANGLSYDGVISGTNAAAVVEFTGQILLGGDSTFLGLTTVTADGAIGGNGSLDGDLTLAPDAGFIFDGDNIGLSIAGTVNLDSTFGIDDLLGIDSSTPDGVYTLIDETSTSFASGFEHIGEANKYDLTGGKYAYFQEGSLQVVVIPEPATLGLVVAFGGSILFIRRRFKI